jgi:two-component system OmpR family response regulator
MLKLMDAAMASLDGSLITIERLQRQARAVHRATRRGLAKSLSEAGASIYSATDLFHASDVLGSVRWQGKIMTPPVVLVVEDEAMILFDVETALTDAGFTVMAAANATQAIEAFDAARDTVRAIVTDIRIGKGGSGWDVGRHVREAVPTMPVIYMSGDSSSEWAAQGVPNSIMISKPFALPQLITAISTLLNQDTGVGE